MPIEFTDPPPPSLRTNEGGRAFWQNVGEQLRERPGEWALIRTNLANSNGHQLSARINLGLQQSLGDGKFEARYVTTTQMPTRRGDLYVRAIQ